MTTSYVPPILEHGITTKEEAYFVGFTLADGCLRHQRTPAAPNKKRKGYTRNGSYRVQWSLQESDAAVVYWIKNLLQHHSPVRHVDVFLHKEYPGKVYRQAQFGVVSKDLFDRLEACGVHPNKSLKEQVPEGLSDDLFAHFARGYMDGDGCVAIRDYGYTRVCFRGGVEFLERFRDELMRRAGVGFHPVGHRKSYTGKVCGQIEWSSCTDVRKLRTYLYPEGDTTEPALHRKKELIFSKE